MIVILMNPDYFTQTMIFKSSFFPRNNKILTQIAHITRFLSSNNANHRNIIVDLL